MSLLNLNNIYRYLTGKGNEVKELKDNDLIAIARNSQGNFLTKGLRFKDLKNAIVKSIPSTISPLPELKEVVTYVTAAQLRGEDFLWYGANITNLTDSENNYASDIDVLIEYTWDTADYNLNGIQAIIGTGSGTVHVVPDTFFTQNYGGVYGVRLPIGPFNTPEYVGVGADTNIYFRMSPTPGWLNGNGSLKIITTYRERVYGN